MFQTKAAFLCLAIVLYSYTVNAAITFLPDYEDKINLNLNTDNQLCSRARKNGEQEYHYAPGAKELKCPNNQVYDYECPHDHDWISKCHCPNGWITCTYPNEGRGEGCLNEQNGQYYYPSCCNPSCSSGGSIGGCSGTETVVSTYTNDCGYTCSTCRLKSSCNTFCYGDEDTVLTGGINDDDGQPCVQCNPRTEAETPPEETPETPSECTDTCSSKNYSSSSNGMDCSTTTVCGNTCYFNCTEREEDDPCKNVSCSNGKTCENGTCKCPAGTKECNGKCIDKNACCSDNDCSGNATCKNGSCIEEKKCTSSEYSLTKPTCGADYDLVTDSAGCYKCSKNSCASDRSSLESAIKAHNSKLSSSTISFCQCNCGGRSIYSNATCKSTVSSLQSRVNSFNSKCSGLNASIDTGCPRADYGIIKYSDGTCSLGLTSDTNPGSGGNRPLRPGSNT